jgi:hypothetical protein
VVVGLGPSGLDDIVRPILLKLWFLDRMTFYYEEHREREEPAEEVKVATTPSSS